MKITHSLGVAISTVALGLLSGASAYAVVSNVSHEQDFLGSFSQNLTTNQIILNNSDGNKIARARTKRVGSYRRRGRIVRGYSRSRRNRRIRR
ncbi:hypothetical protein [Umezakia ovalisporum]|jgi:hypothetical protein|uniref:Uncharacterized protein n=2 Tax=Umezakia ovalisporum TaxID=75695 RepID=A0AA43KFL7_9CYAN|nr:hypothetical protein [Umezakia ovalisporum]MBI1241924.1 hypothetical protein [Nostoc sp. RI_552]MDH6058535.1 hypothetical protein [Umezakia ovalisporum FSS-43]MDH6064979.1 hypothetical protein [Umezakia ovalisporum FSS-62]MDH6067610.1 hypothetical protein [Umezakia ovalisporum APH033B]MDH6069458.1 hypothetical protein [Umezakia ovalisporum CobakiLakeA]